uniref:Uncharacterized protein n=1 Tax=Oncorhynchus mykiss TaxID=8022 RepID=A0A8K9XX66_ONCMY
MLLPEGGEGRDGEKGEGRTRRADIGSDSGPKVSQYYHALMMFTKVDRSRSLQAKFWVAMLSMAKHGLFLDEEVLVLHFVSDEASRELGERMLPELLLGTMSQYEASLIGTRIQKLFPIVEAMQKHLSVDDSVQLLEYTKCLFFILSVCLKQYRIVLLDVDLKYRSNIRELFLEFDRFPSGVVIGIAREMQPVYRYSTHNEHTHAYLFILINKIVQLSLFYYPCEDFGHHKDSETKHTCAHMMCGLLALENISVLLKKLNHCHKLLYKPFHITKINILNWEKQHHSIR